MVVSLARLLVKFRLAWLAGILVTAVSFIFGKKSRIRYKKPGLWMHESRGIILCDMQPDFRHDIKKRFKEIENNYLFSYVPKQGDVCIDIGAGIGVVTIYLARCTGPSGKVYSIEASPATYQALKASVDCNSFSQVQCFQLAVSNSSRPVRISTHGTNYLVNNIFNESGEWVDAITMDDFILQNRIGHIDYMKVNIEGAEALMIQHFNSVKRVKYIAIACHDFLGKQTGGKQFFTKQQVTDFLTEHGFSLTSLNTGVGYLDDCVFGTNMDMV